MRIFSAEFLDYFWRIHWPLETSKRIHYSRLSSPAINLVSGNTSHGCTSIPLRRRVKAREPETSELTYVKIRWITSPRTSCWVLRRGVSASSQMLLKRHCLPSRQPCLKSQHWIFAGFLRSRLFAAFLFFRHLPQFSLILIQHEDNFIKATTCQWNLLQAAKEQKRRVFYKMTAFHANSHEMLA